MLVIISLSSSNFSSNFHSIKMKFYDFDILPFFRLIEQSLSSAMWSQSISSLFTTYCKKQQKIVKMYPQILILHYIWCILGYKRCSNWPKSRLPYYSRVYGSLMSGGLGRKMFLIVPKVGTQIFLLVRKTPIRKFLGSFRNRKSANFWFASLQIEHQQISND